MLIMFTNVNNVYILRKCLACFMFLGIHSRNVNLIYIALFNK